MANTDLERALLKLAFETDVPLTPASVAYHLECPVVEAKQGLEALLDQGALVLDSDSEGNLLYMLPGRSGVRSPAPVLSQRSSQEQLRQRAWAVAANAVLPGSGTLLLGRVGLAALQGAVAMTVIALMGSYWKDFGDDEHRIWLVLLVITYVANLVWALRSALSHHSKT